VSFEVRRVTGATKSTSITRPLSTASSTTSPLIVWRSSLFGGTTGRWRLLLPAGLEVAIGDVILAAADDVLLARSSSDDSDVKVT